MKDNKQNFPENMLYTDAPSTLTATRTPIDLLLKEFAGNKFTGCVKVHNSSITWKVYFQQGNLLFITNTVQPFERLDRYLRILGYQNSQINKNVLAKIRFNFESLAENGERSFWPPDYLAIVWLIENKFIDEKQAQYLIRKITEEAGLTCLLLTEFEQESSVRELSAKIIYEQNILIFINHINLVSKQWQSLYPHVHSGYDRLYLASEKMLEARGDKLNLLLCGYSLYQLATLLNKEPLNIAQLLMPLIVDGRVIVREPDSVFLPLSRILRAGLEAKSKPKNPPDSGSNTLHKLRIVCIDDSSAMLKQMKLFLQDLDCEIFLIDDSVKALMEVVRIKPSMIFMDIEMKSLDGYQLCKLLRNHSLLKNIPIVMLTGHKSVLARAKANIAGATDFITKPFCRSELNRIVYRYLG